VLNGLDCPCGSIGPRHANLGTPSPPTAANERGAPRGTSREHAGSATSASPLFSNDVGEGEADLEEFSLLLGR
jgi:hypothetical protein